MDLATAVSRQSNTGNRATVGSLPPDDEFAVASKPLAKGRWPIISGMPGAIGLRRVGIVATEAEAKKLSDQIAHLLCPNPDHAPPCAIPWSIGIESAEDMDEVRQQQYDDILEQHRIESGMQPD